jgi:LPXTG-site transpeptidase (sortase) family protein
MKNSTAWKLYGLGGALIVIALVLGWQAIGWPFALQAASFTVNLAPATSQSQPQLQKVSGKPVRIRVASRAIDLPVIDGTYDATSGNWTLSNTKAQFALNSSANNNRGGNTFIYGHDVPQVFKALEGLAVGDIAEVTTDNGYVFTYRYRSAIEVEPTNTSIFTYSGPPILTLQTCSGIWSQNRRLMTFDFVEVQKI